MLFCGRDGKGSKLQALAKGRRRAAESLYELDMLLREEGLSDFVYDEGKDLFRFKDGRFAFSRRYADFKLLEERGYYE